MKIYDENIYNKNVSLIIFNMFNAYALDIQGKVVSIKSNYEKTTNTLKSNDKVSLLKDADILLAVQIQP